MTKHDQLHRFLFESHSVRGELVSVSETYQRMLENHNFPQPVQQLLGELLVATSLLTATLKFNGDITVQIQGDGPVKLAVINGNNQQQMRGTARIDGGVDAAAGLRDMIGNGYMVITVTPDEGERYQGVVALEGETLSECLDAYFKQSEQLPTRLFIRTGMQDGKMAAGGMLLQILPGAQEGSDNMFDHLVQLTATIKGEELFTLDAKEILRRLYHEENVTLYEPQCVEFRCSCSRQRCADTLVTIPDADIQEILQQDGKIDMECEFCGVHYIFDENAINEIKASK
ncbi:Hsp33 family molecular chaperone HslO [Xenorhabdus sp. 42]|uniref:33 kDa chaperonin n=1 Tax=Xenorhabdus szentirmaii TaxID=290112 RepID=A0AAW3YZV6_9GAMM|nr:MULTISPECIES: Hsp33 family molecular chaperone HslO [unclassified Xenorhabdus]MBD2781804.1 Hsp33 family molecular chaperone HslO [Xenorhabdus sp. 38]MBD2793274.1 Hsp33 family molecular chaperone HslO [Xenorhabdus sp. CUL]MBD2802434.1 Hsp33 family molecular chaperone HslO [Xenorhabdus sp. M]MBD2820567.1 Hsp33 family molecular chaperone HslO [Xenorhabdus sp. 42]MBD2825862.1 Hsp33 family molecular chaperone HslO [Xenorhabdus sp. 5]